MSTSSDSAEQIVRLSLEGFEVMAKVSGEMAKNIIAGLYALSKDTNKVTNGKTRLTNMIKTGSNLQIFTINKDDYADFRKKAREYKIAYSPLYNKNEKTSDGLVDLIVREEDAVRVNRVVERYNITKVDIEKVEKIIDKADEEKTVVKNSEKPELEKDIQAKNTSEELINVLLKKQNIKEENENTNPSQISSSERDFQSESSLKQNEGNANNKEEKPSIRERLHDIEQEQKEKEKKQKEETKKIHKKDIIQETKHEQPKAKKKKERR